ncbi:MAG TPA: hypothetical protein VGD39_14210 [Nocardioides sp.]
MAWSNSKIFQQFLEDAALNVAAFDLDSDTFKVALYDNDITPDNDASAANSAYNAGQWVTTNNEVFEAGQWAQGGVALTSPAISVATADVVYWDASDTASGSAADLANVYGCLVYDDTLTTPVADQGICYNYFGGTNSVVNGTFTVVWHANGIFRITL